VKNAPSGDRLPKTRQNAFGTATPREGGGYPPSRDEVGASMPTGYPPSRGGTLGYTPPPGSRLRQASGRGGTPWRPLAADPPLLVGLLAALGAEQSASWDPGTPLLTPGSGSTLSRCHIPPLFPGRGKPGSEHITPIAFFLTPDCTRIRRMESGVGGGGMGGDVGVTLGGREGIPLRVRHFTEGGRGWGGPLGGYPRGGGGYPGVPGGTPPETPPGGGGTPPGGGGGYPPVRGGPGGPVWGGPPGVPKSCIPGPWFGGSNRVGNRPCPDPEIGSLLTFFSETICTLK
jgi:hypothetical protein